MTAVSATPASSLARDDEPLRLAQAAAAPGQENEEELVEELSAMLQACSYDGEALQVDAAALSGAQDPTAEETVGKIMRFTGLPQNFKVVEGTVPNAAALIVLGPDGLPQRVIAYNAAFMDEVRDAVARNDWASMSIMAHEIGHHLSGHTLMPGGSQPPIELEADKFSGFVLYKMGASLADAQTAIGTLVPEADGPTHPGRAKRLAAVRSGWTESCEQQGQADCAGDVVLAHAEPTRPALGATPDKPAAPVPAAPAATPPAPAEQPSGPAVAAAPDEPPAARGGSGDLAGLSRGQLEARLIEVMGKLSEPGADIDAVTGEIERINAASAALAENGPPPTPDIPDLTDFPLPGERDVAAMRIARTDKMPRLDAAATPTKFDRFVYDEVGVFDVAVKEKLAGLAFDYAASNNVEIVTIVTDDLQGRSADQYALDAMRQLRVGKLEVGNGAVLVVGTKGGQTGVALGAGLLVEYQDSAPLRSYLESFHELVAGKTKPIYASELVAEATYRIMRDTKAWEWVVRYQSLEEILAADAKADREREATGAKYDPKTDPTWRKIVRVRATVVSTSPDKGDRKLDINAVKERRVGPALHVRTASGQDAVLYANPSVATLMPSALEEGKEYAFVVRDSFLAADTPQFDLLSYDLLR